MKFFYKGLILALLNIPVCCEANDTLINLAQPLTTANNWSYKGGRTNLDGSPAWKNSLMYAEPGWPTNRPAPFGFGGIPSKNTLIPEDNTARGAGPAKPTNLRFLSYKRLNPIK